VNNNAPAKPRPFGGLDYLKINLMALAITALWQSLHSIILPIRILDFVAESQKNTYLGLITFAGLMLAMLAQPLAGALSDRARFSLGRRRPFILGGTLLLVVFLTLFGASPNYAVLLVAYCLMQISSNIIQGPYQAFIPELVPADKRGLASGIKNMAEILGGALLVFISPRLMSNYSPGDGAYWLWLTLGIIGALVIFSALATVLWVKEPRPAARQAPQPFWKTALGAFKLDMRRDRPFLWFLASRLLVYMSLATIQQFALYFFKDVVGVDDPAAASANFIVVAVISMLAAAYPAGRLCDRAGRKPVAAGAALLGAVSILLIIVLPKDYNLLLFPAVLLGMALGAFASSNWAMATDLVPAGEEARYLGIANMATAGGAALARLIGPVIDFFNGQAVNLGYQVMLFFCLGYFLLGALLLLKVKKGATSQT
jgi:Na+/melibiose symporter-like transporter